MRSGYRPVTRDEIAQAVPPGSRVLRSPDVERQYLAVIGSREEFLALRADAREVTLAVAKWLARHASWTDGTTRPTRKLICSLVGAIRGWRLALSLTAWKKARRRLEAWGLLGTVREGSTEQFRPMALARRDGPNEAAVWVLCIPRNLAKTPPATASRDASNIMRPPTWGPPPSPPVKVKTSRPGTRLRRNPGRTESLETRHRQSQEPVKVISPGSGSRGP